MKATLDFTEKTIIFAGPVTLADVQELQQTLVDWREWRIIAAAQVTIQPGLQPCTPSVPAPWWQQPNITWTDNTLKCSGSVL